MDRHRDHGAARRHKLGAVSGVYVPVCLSILSILMFLRFGIILGRVGLLGMLGLLVVSYLVDLLTTLSLSAVASNGEVKGGGTYYLISRSLGPEFGGSIGLLFYLSQVLNTALNVVGLIDCLDPSLGGLVPHGYWWGYLWQTIALFVCTMLCLAGSSLFAKASNGLLAILAVATLSIPLSAAVRAPFTDPVRGIEFTGLSLTTLRANLWPGGGGAIGGAAGGEEDGGGVFSGLATFRDLFGILFPATSGIFAGASMSGDLRNPSKAIPKGTLWAMASTLAVYLGVILAMAASTTPASLLREPNIILQTSVWPPVILAGECAVTFFSALMGLIAAAKLMQALGRDRLVPGLSLFAWGSRRTDEPLPALLATYAIAQLALFADLNQIATFISMGYMVTFFVMNLACFLLKIGSAPNFRPAFQFFSWQTALLGSLMSAAAMFFIDSTYATSAVILLIGLFLLIHYLSPPKHWGDVSQNLIYHQVRKYLLRLKPEHIKFWRPHIILLINNPRRQTRLIQFCNSMKKGALYILGHAIVTDDFSSGVVEAKLQQTMWTEYITEYSRIKAFVQLSMSPSITWGVRNLILASGLGGMRPNIAVLGFYNMDDLRTAQALGAFPATPAGGATAAATPAGGNTATATPLPESTGEDLFAAAFGRLPETMGAASGSASGAALTAAASAASASGPASARVPRRRRRGDTTSRILEGTLPTDIIKTEGMMDPTEYLTILEDLALRHRINVAVAKGFQSLETPRADGSNTGKYIDLWPIQMSAELEANGKSVLTTNFDTYTLILQLGYILHSVPAWKHAYKLRVMVFVEYESEVNEERGRVKALMEKLRISAEVHVFWLACGDLATYEAIIHGRAPDAGMERHVDDVLRDDPWWRHLRAMRGAKAEAEAEAASAEASAAGTPSAMDSPPSPVSATRRRQSIANLGDLHKHNTVAALSRLGLSMGIRTQNLAGDGTHDSDSDSGMGSDGESSASDAVGDFNYDDAAALSDGDVDAEDEAVTMRRPLLSFPVRRKSHGDAILKRPANWLKKKAADANARFRSTAAPPLPPPPTLPPPQKSSPSPPPPLPKTGSASQLLAMRGYGTISSTTISSMGDTHSTDSGPRRSQLAAGLWAQAGVSGSPSIRFSSSLVPETRTLTEETGRTIMFAETEASSGVAQERSGEARTDRPAFSRTNSRQSRVSMAESMTAKKKSKQSVSFATPSESGDASAGGDAGAPGDVKIGISGLLANYKARNRGNNGDRGGGSSNVSANASTNASVNSSDSEPQSVGSSGSSYATQDLPLSFNDLPSRAQYLILNELMRRHSTNSGNGSTGVGRGNGNGSGSGNGKRNADTGQSGGGAAVLFTTLPIPDEGTCRSLPASVQYLADVELLCQGLPPALMILSNNMTVTVSL